MRRVLVPLDGTDLGISILPDARRLAGPDGELVLIHVISSAVYDHSSAIYRQSLFYREPTAVEAAQHYLDLQAEMLHSEGVRARAEALVSMAIPSAIDTAARVFEVDMIACTTHGRTPMGRLLRGSVAWSTLAHSAVPVLLRHPQKGEDIAGSRDSSRRILVPLDGSRLAQQALPLAQQLAREWNASIHLARVALYPQKASMAFRAQDLLRESKAYLHTVAEGMAGTIQTAVLIGPVVDTLTGYVVDQSITDIVMASHGRTGIARAILGSVADGLIHRLHGPIIVIPAMTLRCAKHRQGRVEEIRPLLSTHPE